MVRYQLNTDNLLASVKGALIFLIKSRFFSMKQICSFDFAYLFVDFLMISATSKRAVSASTTDSQQIDERNLRNKKRPLISKLQ